MSTASFIATVPTTPRQAPTTTVHPRALARGTDPDRGGPEQSTSPWKPAPLDNRLAMVRALRGILVRRADSLLDTVSNEIHKSRFEALTSDLLPLLAACRWHEHHAARLLGTSSLRGAPVWLPGQRWRVHRQPLGCVGIVATWNYPVQLLGIQMLQALVAGNRIVVKPSEHAPRSQSLLVDAFRAAGFDSAISVRPATREAGEAMLREETFDHVVFTGSTAVGRRVAAWGAQALVPTTLELSGADSAIVLADADADLAARTIWHAVTLNGGQTCMAPRRVLVDRAIYPRFLAALAPLAAGAAPRRLISPVAAAAAFDVVRETLARDSRARSLSGVAEVPEGDRVRPLAIVDCSADAPLAAGSHFAPFVAVIPVDSLEQAVNVHVRFTQRLATSVFTRHAERVEALLPHLGSGLVTVNDCVLPTGHPACSITGRGVSGWNASRGREGLLAMTRAVQIGTSSRYLRPPLSPPLPAAAARIERFMLRWYGRGTR